MSIAYPADAADDATKVASTPQKPANRVAPVA